MDENHHMVAEHVPKLLTWGWALVVAAFTASSMWLAQRFGAKRTNENVSHLTAKCVEIDKRLQRVESGQAVNQSEHGTILRAVDRIWKKIDG